MIGPIHRLFTWLQLALAPAAPTARPAPLVLVTQPPEPRLRLWVVHVRGIAYGAGATTVAARKEAAERARRYDDAVDPESWSAALPICAVWVCPQDEELFRALIGLELEMGGEAA